MKKNFIQFAAMSLMLFVFVGLSFGQVANTAVPLGFKFAPSDRLPVFAMPAINVDSMLAEDAIDEQFKDRPYRFGYNHLVYYKPENSGTWTNLPNGDRIWQLDVKTPGSYSVNLAFSGFHLPEGSQLFVYSKDHKQVDGPYTSANNTPDKFMGSELIQGDEAVLEYYEPAAVRGQSSFILFRITQGYKDLVGDMKSDGFGTAGSCIHNINCPQYYDVATQKRSVVCILAGSNALCSGALVNNTLNDGTPYVLTANHCGHSDGTWVFRFNWEAPGCQNPSTSPPFQSLHGAVQIASSAVSDFHLTQIDTTPPASFHAFYAGWNYGLTPATSVTCIHHPKGDIKKCTRADNPVTDTFYDAGNGVAVTWQIGQWTDGATEDGSSGSPLFDQNKRIIGQLYGGPSDCGVSADQLRDYYGRFNVSWDSGSIPQTRLKDWLDPNNSSNLTNDGYDPYPVIDSVDIALLSVLSPGGSTCATTIAPSISVVNLGAATDTSITIHYHIDNTTDSTFVWTGSLAPLSIDTITLSALTILPGSHTFYANVNTTSGPADQNLYNDSINSNFIAFNPVSSPAPLAEGFEGVGFPPTGWEITTPGSGTTWLKTDTAGGFGLSLHAVVVDEFSPHSSTVGEMPALISPPVNMSAVATPSFLKFDVAYAAYTSFQNDSLMVLASTDCGATWSKIYLKGGNTLATAPYSAILFVPTDSQWRKEYINISSFAGQASVIFQFVVISGWGNAMYVDNIDLADTSGPTGVSTLANDISVQVFPNPFNQNINLQFTLDAAQNINAAVYAIDGKKLITVLDNQHTDAGTHQLEINTSQLSNGVYILKVNDCFFKLEKLK